MPAKHLKLVVPDVPPYDKRDSWYLSFVGNNLLPLCEKGLFKRYSFGGYGGVGNNQKHVFFRYEAEDEQAALPEVKELAARFPANPPEHGDYDIAGDLGRGENSRFLGVNARHQDQAERGERAFDFMHASARLLLHCLTGPDPQGYWKLEADPGSGFTSVETTLEQYHHLFCHLTAVSTFVAIATHPDKEGGQVLGYFDFWVKKNQDPRWELMSRGKIHH